MIYGKRVIESHEWLYQDGPIRPVRIIDRHFQWKYTLFLSFAIAGSALVFLGPAWYFVAQNYELFIRLADKNDPMLYEQLARESNWLLTFLWISGFSILGLCLFLGLKFTESIVGPVFSLERHMRRLSRGNLSQREFKVRNDDDFRSLALSYNYLFKSLQAQAEQDLQWLEKIQVEPHNREAVEAWQAIIKVKQSQLGKLSPVIATPATTSNETPKMEPNISLVSKAS
jgi:methyl-accepting chemotaxis protein